MRTNGALNVTVTHLNFVVHMKESMSVCNFGNKFFKLMLEKMSVGVHKTEIEKTKFHI